MKKLLLCTASVLLSLPIYAAENPQPHKIDIAAAACLDNAQTTVAIRDCNAQAYKSWDAEMGKQYKLLMADLNPEQKAALRNSQRAWLSYRDSYFKALQSYYSTENGTIWGIVYDEQVNQIVRDKALSLKQLRESTCLAGPDEC